MFTTNPEQTPETQPEELPETPETPPVARSRGELVLAWAQLGVGVLSTTVGTVVGLEVDPFLGAAIVGAGGFTLNVKVVRR